MNETSGKLMADPNLFIKDHRELLLGPINKGSSQGIFQPVVGIDRVPDLWRPANGDGASVAWLIQEDGRKLLPLYRIDEWSLIP